jgi:hypothetical protein
MEKLLTMDAPVWWEPGTPGVLDIGDISVFLGALVALATIFVMVSRWWMRSLRGAAPHVALLMLRLVLQSPKKAVWETMRVQLHLLPLRQQGFDTGSVKWEEAEGPFIT